MTARVRPIRADRTEDAFDRALGPAARSLVVGALPTAVLAAPRPVMAGSRLRSVAPIGVAAAVIAVAIGSLIGAPRPVANEVTPVFRTGSELSVALRGSGFTCRPGTEAVPGRARMEAIVCSASTPSLIATLVLSEDPDGRVGEIHVESDILGAPTATSVRDQASFLMSAIGHPFADPIDAAAVRAWLARVLPLDPGATAHTTVGAVPVVVERGTSGYRFVIGNLGAGAGVVPSG